MKKFIVTEQQLAQANVLFLRDGKYYVSDDADPIIELETPAVSDSMVISIPHSYFSGLFPEGVIEKLQQQLYAENCNDYQYLNVAEALHKGIELGIWGVVQQLKDDKQEIIFSMPSGMEQLNDNEQDFIVDALNFYWHDANNNLQRKDLGDIERKQYELQLVLAKNLMKKLEK